MGRSGGLRVLKFGGSSVATPERVKTVGAIIRGAAKKHRVAVVVSAFQGVTNQLLECAQRAERGDRTFEELYLAVADRHRQACSELLRTSDTSTRESVEHLLQELREALHGISLLRYAPPRALDLTASFGERLSATIISGFLNRSFRAPYVDAREMVVTDDQFMHAAVLFDKTNPAIRATLQRIWKAHGPRAVPVVTGFIGSTEDGLTTTIGRNGSDYTAAIIGAALDASVVEIWTDVDGILSADPTAVPSAFVLSQVSYEEAMELSYFGAKVLHAASIAPAVARDIPILIKNTFNPTAPGTLISRKTDPWEGVAKGISSVDDVTLLTVRGSAMVGVPGTAERLFRTLGSHRVNIILISQASSEHTVCLAVSSSDAPRARKAIMQEFRHEMQLKSLTLDEKPAQTIIAIVGEGMKGTPGVAGKVFNALGRNHVNVSAIAQGASERNISFVIDSQQKVRALNVIHQAFFETRKRLGLVVIGVGNVGGALLRQLEKQQAELRRQGFDIAVYGIANSKRLLFSPAGIALKHWKEQLDAAQEPMQVEALIRHVLSLGVPNIALVDCTADAKLVDAYPNFVKANMHIITPNKLANVLPWKRYAALTELMRERQKYFFYEANVGAGLPIISTLRDLTASGDTVVKIEGIFSGTLSYLFNGYNGGKPFSAFLQEAYQLGFTEPDPRDDLTGEDVGRKLLILARQLGLKMDMKDIRVETLVPAPLRTMKFSDEFFRELAKYDDAMQRRLERARLRGAVLRYVGTFQGNAAYARLREIPLNHPFASTKGSDNIIMFTTHRYSRTPLIVQGPGAGADVTAMGVFSDILKLLHGLPY